MIREFRFNITVPLPTGHFESARLLSQLEAVFEQTKQALASNGVSAVSFNETIVTLRAPAQKQAAKPGSDNPTSETKDKH